MTDDDTLYRSVFDYSGFAMARLGGRLVVRDANREFAVLLDHRPDTLLGRNFLELLHPGSRVALGQRFGLLTDGRRTCFTHRIALGVCPTITVQSELTAVAVRCGSRPTRAVVVIMRPLRADEDRSKVERGMLTVGEARILEGIAEGLSTPQLAARLYLSRQGVEYHVSAMLRRLGVPNRPALVSRAYSTGMLAVGAWPPRVQPDAVRVRNQPAVSR